MSRLPILAIALSVLTAACGSSGPTAADRAPTTATAVGTTPTAPAVTTSTTATTAGTGRGSTTIRTAATTTTTEPTTTLAPPPPPGTGVYGMVVAGPTCPVQRVGQPCPPQPVAAEIDARDPNGHTVATTRSDSAGRYRLSLAPGSYILVVVTGAVFPRCPATPVTVTSGPPVRQDINCDTGIR
jgi:hypothetical protein